MNDLDSINTLLPAKPPFISGIERAIAAHKMTFPAVYRSMMSTKLGSTKVELWFNISESEKLTDAEKEILLKKLASKLEKECVIHLQEQTDRTQLKNKELLKLKFYRLLLSGFKIAKPRKPTKISKAAKTKRLDSKKIKGEIKQLRKKII